MFGLSGKVIAGVSDRRALPRIATSTVVSAALIMFWSRLGSLNALAGAARSPFLREWLGCDMPSADTIGRVFAEIDCAGLRSGLHLAYACLKRNKALPGIAGIDAAILDGHESSASYLSHCAGCLTRTVHTVKGDRVQYYHRNVSLMITGEKYRFLVDVEAQRPGEDEIATALRLLDRVLAAYPRAFQLVLADALYGQAKFINYLRRHGKHALIVLKDERRNIYNDAMPLFATQRPNAGKYRSRDCLWWDDEGFTSWGGITEPLRVVRSLETSRSKRQASGEVEVNESEWMWVTTLPQAMVGTDLIVRLGHARWDVENYGFNYLVNDIRADHVYKHDPNAIIAFYLLSFLAANLFFAFFNFNVKEALRKTMSHAGWTRILSAELHTGIIPAASPDP